MLSYTLIINISVAIGTISLAIVALLSLWVNTAFLRKQVKELKIQNMPVMKLEKVQFISDKIRINLVNMGSSYVRQPVIFVSAYPVIPSYVKKVGEDYIDISSQDIDNKEQIYVDYPSHTDKLVFEGENVKIYDSVSFLSPIKGTHTNLTPQAEVEFEVTPIMLIGPGKDKNEDDFIRWLPPEDFRKFMRDIGLKAVYFHFAVCGKDAMQNVLQPIQFTDFVFDLNFHKNLEEAFREQRHPRFRTVRLEGAPQLLFMSKKMYDGVRIPEPEELSHLK